MVTGVMSTTWVKTTLTVPSAGAGGDGPGGGGGGALGHIQRRKEEERRVSSVWLARRTERPGLRREALQGLFPFDFCM